MSCPSLHEELLDLLLDGGDLRLDLGALVLRDGRRDDRPGHAARAESLLRPNKDVGHVLVLTDERERDVQEDLEGLGRGRLLRISKRDDAGPQL